MKKIILMLSILLITNSYSWRVSKEYIDRFYDASYLDKTVHSTDTTTDGDVVIIKDIDTFKFNNGSMTETTESGNTDHYKDGTLTKTILYYTHDSGYGFKDSSVWQIRRMGNDGIHEYSTHFRRNETVRSESYRLAFTKIDESWIDESYYALRYYSDGNLLQRTDMRTDGSGVTQHLVMVKTLYSKSGKVVGLYKYIKNDVGVWVTRDYRVTPPIGDFDIQYSATFTGNEKDGHPVYVMSKYRDEDELKVEAYTMEECYAGKYSIGNVSAMLREFYNEKND